MIDRAVVVGLVALNIALLAAILAAIVVGLTRKGRLIMWTYLGYWIYFTFIGEGALAIYCAEVGCSGGPTWVGDGDALHALNHTQ